MWNKISSMKLKIYMDQIQFAPIWILNYELRGSSKLYK